MAHTQSRYNFPFFLCKTYFSQGQEGAGRGVPLLTGEGEGWDGGLKKCCGRKKKRSLPFSLSQYHDGALADKVEASQLKSAGQHYLFDDFKCKMTGCKYNKQNMGSYL
jgi:hypothetical protein